MLIVTLIVSLPLIIIIGLTLYILMIGVTVNHAKADYGCINLTGTRSIPSTYTCLDKPTESNIWKSESQLNAALNATGSYHVNGILWVFMNETVTANPTPECKAQNDYFSRITSVSNDTSSMLRNTPKSVF